MQEMEVSTQTLGVLPVLFRGLTTAQRDASGNVAVANPAWFFSVSTTPTPDQQFGSPDAFVPGSLDHPPSKKRR